MPTHNSLYSMAVTLYASVLYKTLKIEYVDEKTAKPSIRKESSAGLVTGGQQ